MMEKNIYKSDAEKLTYVSPASLSSLLEYHVHVPTCSIEGVLDMSSLCMCMHMNLVYGIYM